MLGQLLLELHRQRHIRRNLETGAWEWNEEASYRDVHALAEAKWQATLGAKYQFLHDRVQQAFYERMPIEQRARTHLVLEQRLEAGYK